MAAGGTCSVLYLTADAGEGKTTLISQLAHAQAKRFRKRDSDWLLVPISLAGKPFLRFDTFSSIQQEVVRLASFVPGGHTIPESSQPLQILTFRFNPA